MGREGIRIWHQSMAPLREFGAYAKVLDAHWPSVVSPGTEVVLHGAAPGSYAGRPPAHVLRFPYAKHVIQSQAIERCLDAEQQGFDAVAFATFGDPFLAECRSLVDIPVTSMVEATIFVGCAVAERVALLTLTPKSAPRVWSLIRRHGFETRVSTVMSLDPPVSEHDLLALLEGEPTPAFVDGVVRLIRRAADEGADVVIPAEGVLNEVVHVAGLRRVGEVPVLDGLAAVLGWTEMMVRLQRATGLTVGRVISYPRPDATLLGELRSATLPGKEE